MLHLHRFDDRDALALANRCALGHSDRGEPPAHRRNDRLHAGRRFDGDCGNRILDRRGKPLALGPQRGGRGEFDAVALDKARVDVPGGDLGPLQQRFKELGVGLDARDADFRKGPPRLADQGAEIRWSHMDDHFRQKRVIVRIDDGSRRAPASTRTPGPDGISQRNTDPADGKRAAVGRHGLGVDPHLHRHAARPGGPAGFDPERVEPRSAGDGDLRLNEIEPGDLFGHGMLDLEPRIGLDERGRLLPGRVPVDQEFERAEAHEFRLAGELERRLDDARANGLVERQAPARSRSASDGGAAGCIRDR